MRADDQEAFYATPVTVSRSAGPVEFIRVFMQCVVNARRDATLNVSVCSVQLPIDAMETLLKGLQELIERYDSTGGPTKHA